MVGVLCLAAYMPFIEASSSGNTGPSCGCHGNNPSSSTTVSLSGQPSSYVPAQTYTLTVTVASSAISGSTGGFSLDSNAGSFSNPGANAQLNSGKVTHTNKNARSWTVDWTAPSSGTGTVSFSVVGNAVNNDYAASGDAWNTATFTVPEQPPQNQAPSVTNLVISPSNPTAVDPLSLTYTYSDSDGDPESGTTIRWSRDSSVVSTLDDATSVSSSFLSKGQMWTVTVTPSDGTDMGSSVTSSSVTIQNTPPVANGLSISPTDPTEQDDITMSYSFSDVDLDTESGTVIQWYLDGSRIAEFDGASSISKVSTRSGDVWEVRVTPSDGEDAGTLESASIQIGSSNTAPSIQSLSIMPTNPVTTDDLNMSYTYDDDDGDPSTLVEIQWMKNEIHVPEYNGQSTLPASATSKGEVWKVSVRASDGIDFSPWAESAPRTIGNAPPVLESLNLTPISPSSSEDIQISYDWSDPDGDALALVHVHWHVDGQHVSSYDDILLIEAGQTTRGQIWHAEIVLEDSDGAVSTDHANPAANHVTSSVTIENSNPIVQVELNSEGIENYALDPLQASINSSDVDSDDLEISSIWYRDGFRISALDNQSIVPIDWLGVGQVWTITVSADDGFGGITSISSYSITIGNIAPTAAFLSPDTVMTDSQTVLDAVSSNDPDGSIVAWFWTIGDTTYSGSTVSHVFQPGSTTVNLTVLDEYGGIDSLIVDVEASAGTTISDLIVQREGSVIEISWSWSGSETQFYVWRSSSPLQNRGDLSSATLISTTNETQFEDPIFLAGNHYYTVTVDVDGVENQLISTENLGSIELTNEEIVIQEVEQSALASILIFTWIIISLLVSVGIGIRRRF
ncbi:MAG TPA: choice-of-anchor V domain-containing protein [Candidatus Thalassarchaeaceae archaeon]|nr:choice-of-anchor V domain-containing protein [Candidatus Thalassarchaeaceae archaeon]